MIFEIVNKHHIPKSGNMLQCEIDLSSSDSRFRSEEAIFLSGFKVRQIWSKALKTRDHRLVTMGGILDAVSILPMRH